jgi:ATP-dependent DNA helicase RecG
MRFAEGTASRPEGMGIERMPLQNGLPISFWETYSAFANSGGGTVFLERTGGFESETEDAAEEIRRGVSDRSVISADVLTHSDITVSGEGIEVRIPGADRYLRPVYAGESPLTGTFVRSEGRTVRSDSRNIRSIIRDASDSVTDSEPIPEITIDYADIRSVKKFREMLNSATENNIWRGAADREFLLSSGAASVCGERTCLTPAGMLLFSGHFVSSARYGGYLLEYSEAGFSFSSDDGSRNGGIADYFYTVSERFDRRLGDASGPAKELLINALAHSDYAFGKGVSAKVSARSFSVTNYGLFRPEPMKAFEGERDRRNPVLSGLLGLVSPCRGTGPAVSALESLGYEVSLRQNYVTGSVEITADAGIDGISENIEEIILEEISADPSATVRELSERTGINRRRLERAIAGMKSAGILGREGSRRSGIWVILRSHGKHPSS